MYIIWLQQNARLICSVFCACQGDQERYSLRPVSSRFSWCALNESGPSPACVQIASSRIGGGTDTPSATTPIVSLNTRGVSLIDTRGLHVDKTRSTLCSHLPLARTSILLGARRWANFAMDDPFISASQSSIIYIFVRKFTIVVIFYHTIFAIHGFDFRTCVTPQDVIPTQDVIIAARYNTIYARCNKNAKCNKFYARCNNTYQREM